MGLEVYDTQREQTVYWLQDTIVLDFMWSPQGSHLGVVVEQGSCTELWFVDRFGYPIRKLKPKEQWGRIEAISWSPNGQMLALQFSNGQQDQIRVTYFQTEVYLPVSGQSGGKEPVWLEDGLYFTRGDVWYSTQAPTVRPVLVSNPVPVVLQRQRILSPTVIREGDTIRLTRPSLALP
ncbi:MAG: hypothetical protein GX956_10570 [Firmicutes bacterium]|nr:hypothetical protein [Bacillota bacterium]